VGRGGAAGGFAVKVWVEIGERKWRVELPPDLGAGAVECLVDERVMRADVRMLEPGVMSLVVEGRQYRCVLDGDGVVIDGRRYGFAVEDPRSLQGRRGSAGGAQGPRPVKAPMPGRVVRLLVAVGDEVAEGQGVVVIEAMKMQNELKASKAGRVAKVGVVAGDTVGAGDVLVVVE
jgi:biotin carboxyl carrier protein